jgi:DNA-binding SARP family transcriptional activator/tetratricopeptide (TPR) repeat protein
LRLVGDPALISPAGEEQPLERRAAALFALAAIEPGISRRQAAAMLWPGSDAPNARQALRQQLLRVKNHAGEELITGHTALRLAERLSTDLDRDDAGGTLLGRFDYADEEELAQWVERQRRARRETSVLRLRRELEERERAGDSEASVRIALQLVDADPDSEQSHRALMRAHYLAGDTAQAQASYERLRAMLATEFGAQPAAETEQLAGTIRLARQARPAAPSGPPPPSVLRPPRLVGREREWTALEECLAASGTGIVSGVAGLGKTRLLGDFATSHGPLAMVCARPGDALVSYSLLARMVRAFVARLRTPPAPGVRTQLARLLPELGDADPIHDKSDLLRLLHAVDLLVEQSIAEGLAGFVLDDLHYADAASLDALQAQLPTERRMAFLVSCRGDELGERARAFLDALAATGARRIELPALTVEQVRELLESLELPAIDAARFAPEIARHTGGNPLFVLETVKAMLQDRSGTGMRLPVAGSVAALIERRLKRLSPAARRIARCAAVAGREFSIELAARVLDAHPVDLADPWTELEAAQVFSGGAFAHDLIFESARASVPAAIARRMHAEIAACLESTATDPARIGEHWEAAGEGHKAGEAFARAAAQAKAIGRRIEEANLLGRAARCFAERKDADAAFEALLARAEAMIYNDLGETTLASVLAAEAAARNDVQRLRALLCKAEFFGNRSDSEAAVETGRVGIKLARRSRHPELSVRFTLVVAGGLCELRRVDEALALLEPLREWAGTTLVPRARIEFLVQLGITLDLANRLADALSAFDSARAIAAAEGFKDLLATALSNLATTTSKRGRLTRAVEYGRQALQLSRESELLKGTPLQTQALLAHRLRDLGHYDEAIAMLEESLGEFRRAGTRYWVFATAHRLALAYAHVGQHARAMHLLADDPAGLPVKMQAIWTAHRAEVARLAGGDAITPIRAALALLGGDLDDGNNRLVSLLASAVVPPAEGEPMATSVAAWAEARERFGMAVAAHVRAASCALAQGAVDRAEPQVDAALRLFAEFEPDNFYRAEAWWIAAQVLRAAKLDSRAHRLLAEGSEWIHRIASEHVAPEFRDSFLRRNPVNRLLLAAAANASRPA